MTNPEASYPHPELLPGLLKIEDPLLVSRYRRALERLIGRATQLPVFHVDVTGWSPEVAQELGDLNYMGGITDATFILVSVDQSRCPLVHPAAGLGAAVFRAFLSRHTTELARLTVHEALYGELSHGLPRISSPHQLASIDQLRFALESESERLKAAREFHQLATELQELDGRWADDAFLESMLKVAEHIDHLHPLPELARVWNLPVDTGFVPLFEGTYVYRRNHGLDGGRTFVLTSLPQDPEAPPEGATVQAQQPDVVVVLLNPENAVAFLQDQQLVRDTVDPRHVEELEEVLGWVAIDALSLRDQPIPDTLHACARVLRHMPDAPTEFLELDEVVGQLKLGNAVDLTRFSPLTRLRLLEPSPEAGSYGAFVLHLRAYFDRASVPRAVRFAPDLFYTRYATLSAAQRQHLSATGQKGE